MIITMKRILFVAVAATIALYGCREHNHDHNAGEVHEHVHQHSFTAYSHKVEFFMQHEGLVVGKKSCITLYATALDDFKPVSSKQVKATLKVGDKVQEMHADAAHAGIFHFDFVPEAAGAGVLAFELDGEMSHFDVDVHKAGEEHNHGDGHAHDHSAEEHSHSEAHHSHDHSCEGHSHADGHAHDHSAEEHSHSEAHHSHGHSCEGHDHTHVHAVHGVATEGKPGDVAFSKEQSWKIDFATGIAVEGSFAGAVKIAARVDAVPSDFTTVVATTSGKVQFAGNLVAGKEVANGEALFWLEGGDVTDNDAAVKFAETESNYIVAKADFERKKLLFADKIVSERDYQAAEAAFRQAEVRLNSMKRHFGNGKVTLRSTIKGYVAELLVSNGDYVEPGTPLAKIQRSGQVNILAELPVRYAAQLANIESVNIELPSGNIVNIENAGGRVLAVGSSANGCNMLPVTVSVKYLDEVVPGSIVTLYINSADKKTPGVVVPRTALVEEMGNFFVFVQNSPVSFEKRSVEVGATDGYSVKLKSGVKAGERIVTKGGVALKLSQGAAALDPHAGHVH